MSVLSGRRDLYDMDKAQTVSRGSVEPRIGRMLYHDDGVSSYEKHLHVPRDRLIEKRTHRTLGEMITTLTR